MHRETPEPSWGSWFIPGGRRDLIVIASPAKIRLVKTGRSTENEEIGMNYRILLISVLAFSVVAEATEWRPSEDFLRAVKFVESSNGLFKVGDNGQSLGDFQLSEAAWLDVSEWRKARRLKTYEYDKAVFHSFINRVYASNYLTILHSELSRRLGRAPDHGELYAAYNMGMAMFADCKFSLSRVNPVTRAKAEQIGAMLSTKMSL